ncbi:MAG: 50S ribosomal protein L18 [Candidatus Liptonbacteria bacterium]|nr:50S ribosomal protein L18 [Candidatus Liptonbacteria bacterium]
MNPRKELNQVRTRRVNRVRGHIVGTALRPRLAIFRSNRGLEAQLIDDQTGRTLAAASSRNLPDKKSKSAKVSIAALVGQDLAAKAVAAGIVKAAVDRRWYKYHGRVKALVEAARQSGLQL